MGVVGSRAPSDGAPTAPVGRRVPRGLPPQSSGVLVDSNIGRSPTTTTGGPVRGRRPRRARFTEHSASRLLPCIRRIENSAYIQSTGSLIVWRAATYG